VPGRLVARAGAALELNMKKTALAIALLALVAGCASVPPPAPSMMVLPGTGKSFDEFRHDDHDCRGYAQVQSGAQAADAAVSSAGANSAVVGALVGATAGAALGGNGHAALAGAGLGTATGALVGTGGAAAQAGYSVQRRYDNAFVQCMYAKGNKVPVASGYRGHLGYTPPSYRQAAPPPPPPPPSGTPPPPPPAPRQG